MKAPRIKIIDTNLPAIECMCPTTSSSISLLQEYKESKRQLRKVEILWQILGESASTLGLL